MRIGIARGDSLGVEIAPLMPVDTRTSSGSDPCERSTDGCCSFEKGSAADRHRLTPFGQTLTHLSRVGPALRLSSTQAHHSFDRTRPLRGSSPDPSLKTVSPTLSADPSAPLSWREYPGTIPSALSVSCGRSDPIAGDDKPLRPAPSRAGISLSPKRVPGPGALVHPIGVTLAWCGPSGIPST